MAASVVSALLSWISKTNAELKQKITYKNDVGSVCEPRLQAFSAATQTHGIRIIGTGPFLANKIENLSREVEVHMRNVFIGLDFSTLEVSGMEKRQQQAAP